MTNTESNNNHHSKLVLVAEDDSDICALIEYRLGMAGYNVMTVTDGRSAVEAFQNNEPALVLLDVMMPHVDGFEVTRRIRAHPERGRTPVIILSASVQDKSVARGFDAGADDFMRKPFSPKELLSRVQAVLGRA